VRGAPDLSHLLPLYIMGLMVGFLGSLAGLGGGVFVVPLLALYFDFPLQTAVGASLCCIAATSCSSSVVYLRGGMTNVRLGLLLETITAAGAVTGGLLAARSPESLLLTLLALVLFASAMALHMRGRAAEPGVQTAPAPGGQGERVGSGLLDGTYFDPSLKERVHYRVKRLPWGMVSSAVAGLLAGALGVGGGPLKVPVMRLMMGMPMKATVATSSFMVGITAAAGAAVYWLNGSMDPFLTAPVVLGIVTGARVGSHAARNSRPASLSYVVSLVLVGLGVQTLLKVMGG